MERPDCAANVFVVALFAGQTIHYVLFEADFAVFNCTCCFVACKVCVFIFRFK